MKTTSHQSALQFLDLSTDVVNDTTFEEELNDEGMYDALFSHTTLYLYIDLLRSRIHRWCERHKLGWAPLTSSFCRPARACRGELRNNRFASDRTLKKEGTFRTCVVWWWGAQSCREMTAKKESFSWRWECWQLTIRDVQDTRTWE